MSRAWLIARSEYLRRVRSRWFLVGTILAPMLMLGVTGGMGVLAASSVAAGFEEPVSLPAAVRDGFRVEVVGAGAVADAIAAALPDSVESARPAEPSGDSVAVAVVVPADALSLGSTVEVLLPPRATLAEHRIANEAVDRGVRRARGRATGASDAALDAYAADVLTDAERAGGPASDNRPDPDALSEEDVEAGVRYGLGIGLGFLVSMLSGLYGGAVLRGVVEEKADKIMEVLLSSASPSDLMAGKVLGIGAVGLTQVAIWAVLAGLAAAVVAALAASAGTDVGLVLDAAAGALSMAEGLAVLALALGAYFLTAALHAAVGSAVQQEADAQHLAVPLSLLLLVPLACVPLVAGAPDGLLATVLSLVPPVSASVLPVRFAVSAVPVWQTVVAVALLAVSLRVTLVLAGRVYRIGVLSSGARPALADLWRWAKTP